MTSDWDTALDQLRAAVQNLLRGDGRAYGLLWSHADDVSMMGAHGGLATGWGQVSAAIDRAAANYDGWHPAYQEQLVAAASADSMGYVILRESVGNTAVPDQVRHRRVTVLFRKETDGWRVFHHHSDPLHDLARR
ncbi:YybH family protein [Streptomyces atroolivaceus]|uniref:YybH family protein n=1 Tax=Streptomyces atroolivaceus TaxID=66869 RepID=UPI003789B876